jgi:uncharacterized protein YlxW (UPF0749 family)
VRNQYKFSLVLLIVGFMVAVQYNTVKKPEVRDTRDVWAIRHELAAEKKIHSELLSDLRELDKTIDTYQASKEENAGKALLDTVDKLYEQAGMTDMEGPGLVIQINPSSESVAFGLPIEGISPDLLTRFLNEINRVKGNSIEIDGKRFTKLSSIRDINGKTTVDGLNVSAPPISVKIITQTFANSEKLFNTLHASEIHDDFYLDNLILEIGEPEKEIKIRGWKERYANLFLKELPKGE